MRGTEGEFETLVEDVKGNTLTLTLLCGFLKRAFHQPDRVKFENLDQKMTDGPRGTIVLVWNKLKEAG